MKITNTDGSNKIMVEVEDAEVQSMKDRIYEYIRHKVTQEIIAKLTDDFLKDEEFIKAIKENVKARLKDLSIQIELH